MLNVSTLTLSRTCNRCRFGISATGKGKASKPEDAVKLYGLAALNLTEKMRQAGWRQDQDGADYCPNCVTKLKREDRFSFRG
jgi:hypothetical protein